MKMRKALVGLFVALSAGLASQANAQSTVFALDFRGGAQLISFPINAPAYTPVGIVGLNCFGFDFNEDGSVLYGISNPANELVSIDQTTGVPTVIAPITGATQANWGDLSYDSTTDTMYAMGGNTLYTLDLTTGVMTLVAPIVGGPAAPLYIDLAVDSNGNMFGHDIATDVIVSINKTTGAATTLGPTGLLANFAQGMDFDPATNILYATLYTGGGVGNFVSINTTTGAATVIANTQPWTAVGPEMEMAIKGEASQCYPDCNGDGQLLANDFGCYQTKFVQGDMYADCNGDGQLTAPDFGCFQTKFVVGCP
jgi:hypothetical protein